MAQGSCRCRSTPADVTRTNRARRAERAAAALMRLEVAVQSVGRGPLLPSHLRRERAGGRAGEWVVGPAECCGRSTPHSTRRPRSPPTAWRGRRWCPWRTPPRPRRPPAAGPRQRAPAGPRSRPAGAWALTHACARARQPGPMAAGAVQRGVAPGARAPSPPLHRALDCLPACAACTIHAHTLRVPIIITKPQHHCDIWPPRPSCPPCQPRTSRSGP